MVDWSLGIELSGAGMIGTGVRGTGLGQSGLAMLRQESLENGLGQERTKYRRGAPTWTGAMSGRK